jgi:hypothetical protein
VTANGATLLSNYTLAAPTEGVLTVGKAALTVTADSQSKVYGADGLKISLFTTTGLVSGDSVSAVNLASAGAAAGANVGSYAIIASNATGTGLGNYNITYVAAPGGLTVTPASLTIAVLNANKTYDGQGYSGGNGVSYTGFVNGDSADSLSGVLTYAGAAQGAVNAGHYTLSAGGLSDANYIINWLPGTLTINPAALLVVANAQSRVYGNANPALTYTQTGLVAGDVLSGSLATSANGLSNVGNYAIGQGNLSASANYVLSFEGSTLTITPRPITVTAQGAQRPYGAINPALSYTVGDMGLVNGDSLTGQLSTSAVAASDAGLYPILQGTLVATPNYTLTYVGAELSVTAAPSSSAIADPARFVVRTSPEAAPDASGPVCLPHPVFGGLAGQNTTSTKPEAPNQGVAGCQGG